jgi:hypothetical protein
VPLFDAGRDAPALLAAGDRVRFEPVSTDEHRRLAAAIRAAELDPARWLADPAGAAATGRGS